MKKINFEIPSGVVIIGDPCYKKSEQISLAVQNGLWVGRVKLRQGWVGELIVSHDTNKYYRWKLLDEIGVDSGQAGIFDISIYPEGETGEYGNLRTFYGKACRASLGSGSSQGEAYEHYTFLLKTWKESLANKDDSLSAKHKREQIQYFKDKLKTLKKHAPHYFGSVSNMGICSRSGYGDGYYPVYISRIKDVVTAIKIVF